MAAKQDGILTRKWADRSTPEQVIIAAGAIYLGSIVIKKAREAFAAPKESFYYPPGQNPAALQYSFGGSSQAMINVDPRPLVDKIAELTRGMNVWNYPEEVNRLADLTKDELVIAYNYWQQTYGGSLTQHLAGETSATGWTGGSYYDPAINALKAAQLY